MGEARGPSRGRKETEGGDEEKRVRKRRSRCLLTHT